MSRLNSYHNHKCISSFGSAYPAIKYFIRVVCLAIILLASGNKSVEAQQNINYAVHANILYRFTKYIDWPATHKSGDFVIGVVGESPLFDELRSFINNKTVGDQKIIVRRIAASATSFTGHIIFIPDHENDKLKKIALMTTGSSILIVTETSGSAKKGSCISLVTVNEHLKMEINKNNIDQRRLSIAPELLQLGNVVK